MSKYLVQSITLVDTQIMISCLLLLRNDRCLRDSTSCVDAIESRSTWKVHVYNEWVYVVLDEYVRGWRMNARSVNEWMPAISLHTHTHIQTDGLERACMTACLYWCKQAYMPAIQASTVKCMTFHSWARFSIMTIYIYIYTHTHIIYINM